MMDGGPSLGRVLMIVGVAILALGALLTVAPRVPWLGRLPGDFSFGGGNWRVYVPLGTSLLLSLVLTLLLWLFGRRH